MTVSRERDILHVDMDAFFASVEQRDNAALRGRPVLVGHDGPRGVVAAASYEARKFGCRSAQPIGAAKRRCPEAVIVPPRHGRYVEVSRAVFAIFESFTPLVEPLSIDEAFLDTTGSRALFGDGVAIARAVKARVHEATGLRASVGIAPCKFLAKLASDLDKPDGLTILTAEDIGGRVAALPIERMWGVGPRAAERLRSLGIRTFADVQARTLEAMPPGLGALAPHIWRLARGLDDRPVVPDHAARSISHEETFGTDLGDPDAVRSVALRQSERVAERLRKHGLRARTITVKIRTADFSTVTRSSTLEEATDATDAVWGAARRLLDRWIASRFEPVRLLGVGGSNLATDAAAQLELFPPVEDGRRRRLDETADAIRARFGGRSIHRGMRAGETRDGGS